MHIRDYNYLHLYMFLSRKRKHIYIILIAHKIFPQYLFFALRYLLNLLL